MPTITVPRNDMLLPMEQAKAHFSAAHNFAKVKLNAWDNKLSCLSGTIMSDHYKQSFCQAHASVQQDIRTMHDSFDRLKDLTQVAKNIIYRKIGYDFESDSCDDVDVFLKTLECPHGSHNAVHDIGEQLDTENGSDPDDDVFAESLLCEPSAIDDVYHVSGLLDGQLQETSRAMDRVEDEFNRLTKQTRRVFKVG